MYLNKEKLSDDEIRIAATELMELYLKVRKMREDMIFCSAVSNMNNASMRIELLNATSYLELAATAINKAYLTI